MSEQNLAAEVETLKKELAFLDEELGKAESFFRVLYEKNPNGVVIGDANAMLKSNPVAEELTGAAPTAAGGPEGWVQEYGLFMADGVTPHPAETLPLVRSMHGETLRGYLMWIRSPKREHGVWIDVSSRPLPNGAALCVFRDVTREREVLAALEQRNRDLAEREEQNRELVSRLRMTLEALSTPVIEVARDVLALPVIGVVDTERSARMTEKLLEEVTRARARFVVIDLTGVAVVDTSTADRFLKLAASLKLLGTECVICGIQPAVAQTLVAIGVDLSALVTQRDLQHALEYCERQRKLDAS